MESNIVVKEEGREERERENGFASVLSSKGTSSGEPGVALALVWSVSEGLPATRWSSESFPRPRFS